MPKILEWINGKKMYIGAFVGAVALIAHKLGIDVPGVSIDDAQVTNDLWLLFMTFAGAHKLQKIADAVNNKEKK